MSNLKLVSSFLKIRFHNIGTLLLKTATTYAVGGFAAIQLSSIVVDNVSTEEVLGLTPESFMQLLFGVKSEFSSYRCLACSMYRKNILISFE